MQSNLASKVRAHPRFAELVQKKSSLSWALAIAQIVIYFGFTTLVAVNPDFLRQSLSGGVTTVGIPVGVAVIVSAFVLAGIYVWRANSTFDEINQQIVDEVTK